MTNDEREEFLEQLHVGVLGIEREDGPPLVVPIWYAYERGGNVKIITHNASLKARLIEAAGRFSLCAQTERLPYKYVTVEGPVVESRPCDVEGDSRPMARRYLGRSQGDAYIEDGDDTNSVVFAMRPERWFSVDYGKAD
ncbi:MAG: pyridoxamine 5'-phosphate oxidase family protein [Acidimicrobiales bacterium]